MADNIPDNLFVESDPDCQVAPVPKVNFDFIQGCSISPTPPPIFECVLPIVPRTPDFQCPEFTTGSTIRVATAAAGCDNTPRALLTITRPSKDTNPCEYEINLDINVPVPDIPCPQINIAPTSQSVYFVDNANCPAKTSTLTINRRHTLATCNGPGQCTFDIALDINIPIPRLKCPEFSLNRFRVNTYFEDENSDACKINNVFFITPRHEEPQNCNDPGRCIFDVELAINIPVPRIKCPIISVTEFNVDTYFYDPNDPNDICGSGANNNKFRIIPRHINPQNCNDPGQCIFDVELVIEVPIPRIPCPEFNLLDFGVSTYFVGDDSITGCTIKENKFSIARRNSGSAATATPVKAKDSVYQINNVTNKITADGVVLNQDDVFIWTPKNTNPGGAGAVVSDNHRAGVYVVDYTKATGGDPFNVITRVSYLDSTLDFLTNSYRQFLVADGLTNKSKLFELNVVEGFVFGTDAATFSPATASSCKDPNACIFDVEVYINVPIPRIPCPEITVTEFVVNPHIDRPECPVRENKFRIYPVRQSPTTCEDPGRCDFNVELVIDIPIPLPPCPQFNVLPTQVNSYFNKPGCKKNNTKFSITPRHTDPTCDGPGQCTFDVELIIDIPIPVPRCPQLNVKKFSVDSGYVNYGGCTTKQNRFAITPNHTEPTCNDPGQCVFDIELEIYIPLIGPVCPAFVVSANFASGAYAGSTCAAANQSTVLSLPNARNFGAGNASAFYIIARNIPATCKTPPICVFEFGLGVAITVPKPKCPSLNVLLSRVNASYENNTNLDFRIVKRPVTKDCEVDECNFDFYLSIDIRIPKPPCPTITPGPVVIRKIDPDQNPTGQLTINSATNPGYYCNYNIGLQLNLPLCKTTIEYDFTGQKTGVGPENQRVVICYHKKGTACPGGQHKASLAIVRDQYDKCKYWIAPYVKLCIELPTIEPQETEYEGYQPGGGTGLVGGTYNPIEYIKLEETTDGGGCGSGGGKSLTYKPKLKLKPKALRGGKVTITPSGIGTGEIKFVEESGFTYIDIDLDFQTTACPASDSGSGSGGGSGGGSSGGDCPPQITGPSGPKGEKGEQGDKGITGVTGPTGITGVTGVTGFQGDRGQPGIDGQSGVSGMTGPSGMTGVTGVTGVSGASGSIGLGGPKGFDGQPGLMGMTGVTGPTGPEGSTGVTGVTGITGVTGPDGPSGPSGPSGASGGTGPSGGRGPSGASGGTGPSGGRGQSGPKGERGEKGITGATGPTGRTGATGPSGPPGSTGPSGSPGATGPSGLGLTGAPGLTGVTGATGPAGLGVTGVTGLTGPKGDKGTTGVTGLTGVTGPTGLCGPPGAPGEQGIPGFTGPTGGAMLTADFLAQLIVAINTNAALRTAIRNV